MKLFVSSRLFAPRRMTPKPRHDSARALTGSRCAMSSASSFEAASMVTRTDMTLSPGWLLPDCSRTIPSPGRRPTRNRRSQYPPALSALAADAPAAHAHVREKQNDEDDDEDDPGHHMHLQF